jgi:hypothetical protein
MALADSLSIDRLRSGAASAGAFVRHPRRPAGLARTDVSRAKLTPAALLGFFTIALPWLLIVVARAVQPPLGRGRIVGDPWSVLAPGFGAWAMVGLLIVAVGGLIAWARLRLPAPDVSRSFIVAIVSLVLFVFWCGVAVFLWSPSPSGAWRWTIVAMGVVIATMLGLFAGAQPEGRRGILFGVFATGTLTALIGVIDLLGFPGGAHRIISPLDPTANGMVIGLGVLVALALDQGEHPQRRRWLRGSATLGLAALILTASRGAVCVTVFGMIVLAVRGVPIGWPLLQAFGGALPAVLTALLPGGVARAGETDLAGRALVAALLIGGVALVAWSGARDTGPPPALRKAMRDWRVQVATVVLAIIVALGIAALQPGGIKGTYNQTRASIVERSTPGQPANASRLWSGTSDGRWWRWQAALDAYQQDARWVIGLGPGSSAQTLRRYRTEATPDLSIPSAPIAILTESGAVGLLLVLMGVIGLSVAARQERKRTPQPDGAILLTIGSVVLVHTLFNDSLHQPLILIPAFAAVAALCSRRSIEQELGPEPELNTPPVRRSVATGVGVLIAIVIGLGAMVPARAQLKAREAEVQLALGTTAGLRDAALFANQAEQLDPLAWQGDAIGSQAALALQRWSEARRLAIEAVTRAPNEAAAWRALAYVALAEHDRPGALAAARRLQQLDPAAETTAEISRAAILDSAPPEASPTAIGTPLSPVAQ